MMSCHDVLARLLAVGTLVSIGITSAAAQVYVLQSSAPGLKAGATLDPSASLDLPEGTTVTLMLPSGKTQTLRGAVSRKVSELAAGERIDKAVWSTVSDLVKSGGGSESGVGAVRSAAPATSRAHAGFSTTAVPIDAANNHCLEAGVCTEISRINTSRSYDVTVVDLEDRKRAVVTFAQGAATVAWPAAVPITDGHRYAFLIQGASMRQFRLRLLKDKPAKDEIVRALAAAECGSQISAWIRSLSN